MGKRDQVTPRAGRLQTDGPTPPDATPHRMGIEAMIYALFGILVVRPLLWLHDTYLRLRRAL